jgi:hypothetical protein
MAAGPDVCHRPSGSARASGRGARVRQERFWPGRPRCSGASQPPMRAHRRCLRLAATMSGARGRPRGLHTDCGPWLAGRSDRARRPGQGPEAPSVSHGGRPRLAPADDARPPTVLERGHPSDDDGIVGDAQGATHGCRTIRMAGRRDGSPGSGPGPAPRWPVALEADRVELQLGVGNTTARCHPARMMRPARYPRCVQDAARGPAAARRQLTRRSTSGSRALARDATAADADPPHGLLRRAWLELGDEVQSPAWSSGRYRAAR